MKQQQFRGRENEVVINDDDHDNSEKSSLLLLYNYTDEKNDNNNNVVLNAYNTNSLVVKGNKFSRNFYFNCCSDFGFNNNNSNNSNNDDNNNRMKAICSCILYSFCSVSMILVNKSLASSYNHFIDGDGDLLVLLVVFQALVAYICVELCKIMKLVEYSSISWGKIINWVPLNILFCCMLYTGMVSLQYNTVPMVTIFKNITNIFTTFGDQIFYNNKPENLVILAFAIMLFGAIAAAWNDINITLIGLSWMLLNCISTSGYVLYMRHVTTTSQNMEMSKFGMVMINNLLCVILLFPASIIRGDVTLFIQTNAIHNIGYVFKNIFAGLIGFGLNFASLHCVQTTGPTTYAIVGSMNKIPVAFLGYILFDNNITFETWCYISVCLLGGFLYTHAKLQSTKTTGTAKPNKAKSELTELKRSNNTSVDIENNNDDDDTMSVQSETESSL